jgi:drug/metabolite transporter (DMT)-like permease
MAELLALTAALLYSSSQISAKRGTETGHLTSGSLLGLATGTAGVGLLATISVTSWALPLEFAVLFALGGVAGAGVGRVLSMRSARDVGTSVSIPVISSVNPALTCLAGVLLFAERIGPAQLLALAVILGGVWLCARGGSANKEPSSARAPWRHPLPGLAVAAAAGAAFSASDVFRKAAVSQSVDPVLGALVGMVAALVLWSAIHLLVPSQRQPFQLRTASARWFGLSGLLGAHAQVFIIMALDRGDLSVVSPIMAAQPVLAVLLAGIFLRRLEQLRAGTVMGAIAVFVGVAALALT